MLRRRIRHVLQATSADGGQVAVMMVVVLTLFTSSGFLVVDLGSWYGARRDVQADADFSALAGAIELPSFEDDAGAVLRAQSAAEDWAVANDVDPADLTVEVVNDCYSGNDAVHTGVRVSVQREPNSYFISLFPGIPTPTVSAVAVACSGTPQSMIGFVPLALPLTSGCFQDDPLDPTQRIPIYGERCDLVVAAGSPGVGQLGFDDPGGCSDGDAGGSFQGNIVTGVDRLCSIGDSVANNPGLNVGQTQKGLQDRLFAEGSCATAAVPIFTEVQNMTTVFNNEPITDLLIPLPAGLDDLFEVWGRGPDYNANVPAENLTPYDCDSATEGSQTSPRNIVVVVVQDLAIGDGVGCTGISGSFCYEIRGFARMYLEGCSSAPSGFKPACDIVGAGSSFTVHARFVDSTALSSSTIALSRFGDTLTFLKD